MNCRLLVMVLRVAFLPARPGWSLSLKFRLARSPHFWCNTPMIKVLSILLVWIATYQISAAESRRPSLDSLIVRLEKTINSGVVTELEQTVNEWRGKNHVLPRSRDGQSMLMAFHFALRRYRPYSGKPAEHLEKVLADWERAYPQSTAWRIWRAEHLVMGTSLDRSAAEIEASLKAADRLLRDCLNVGERTADWYATVMMLTGTGAYHENLSGYERPNWLRNWQPLADQGIKRYGSYHLIYTRVAMHLQALGYQGSLDDWGRHVCGLLPGRGLEPYARLIWSMENTLGDDLFSAGRVDWDPVRRGFQDLLANGWDTSWNRAHFLIFARRAEDHATARRLLAEIGDQPDPKAFGIAAKFLEIQAWAKEESPVLKPLWSAHGREAHSVAWSPDGRRVFAGFHSKKLSALDAADGKVAAYWEMGDHAESVVDIAVSPDGRFLAAVTGYETYSTPGSCHLWNLQTQKPVLSFQTEKGPFHVVAFSPDGSELIAGGGLYAGPSQVWHWRASQGVKLLPWAGNHIHTIYALAWSPDASTVIFNCNSSKITVAEDARAIRLVKQVSTPGLSNASCLQYSPDGTLVAAALRRSWYDKDKANGCVAIFDARTFQPREDVLAPLTGGLLSLDFAPDGKTLAAVGYDGYIYILDTATLAIRAWWNAGEGILMKVRWSPDGTRLATAADKGIVSVWAAPALQ